MIDGNPLVNYNRVKSSGELHKQEQLLTVEEVAQETRAHEKTVRKWIKDRELAAIDVGREYRIRRSNLEDFKRRRQTNL